MPVRSWPSCLLLFGALALVPTGSLQAQPAASDLLGRFAGEPPVRTLQLAAARLAEAQPERVRSWLRRVRTAALMPSLRARVGRGLTGEAITRGLDGIDRISTLQTDGWRFDVEAIWALDRLVFDPSELRLSREAQRLAARREQLLSEIAQLYFARRRLQVDALLDVSAQHDTALDRALAIDELTAILDGLTGGRLSEAKGGP